MATVLVVDDDADIRELVRVALETYGHDVVVAPDGPSALGSLDSRNPPDVILLDVMMPGMDGWQVLARIKAADEPLASVPVLMLTARQADVDRIRSGIEGALAHIGKPFAIDDLAEHVLDAMSGSEHERRRAGQNAALGRLARIESGERGDAPASTRAARPLLTRLERGGGTARPRDTDQDAAVDVRVSKVADLSTKQRQLLEAVRDAPTVSAAAVQLDVSRANVYASLRRIARRIGVASVHELVQLVRGGGLVLDG